MIVATGWLATLCCADCGDAAIMTVAPGSAAVIAPGNFVACRDEPTRAWCRCCAQKHGWVREAT